MLQGERNVILDLIEDLRLTVLSLEVSPQRPCSLLIAHRYTLSSRI
jgi:hypothetical protein